MNFNRKMKRENVCRDTVYHHRYPWLVISDTRRFTPEDYYPAIATLLIHLHNIPRTEKSLPNLDK